MKYSSALLQKFIAIQDTPENIAQELILRTCEIEEVTKRQISDSVVIWYVKSCEKHPEADKLSVCQVDCGKKWTHQILCGGANIKAGMYVPVALPGTHLEKIGITIEPRMMKGLESHGMICSKEELWINEDIEKHFIRSLTDDLDDISDKDLWIPFVKKFPRIEGRIMEVDNKSVTHRPDLTWHFGIATELNAIYGLAWSLKLKAGGAISFNTIQDYYRQCTHKHIMEILENSTKPERKVVGQSKDLNAYLLLHLKDVTVRPASFFTRLQMIDIDSGPINNRVDFSNLFMNISGQPVHFFDAEKVEGDIIVRNAKEGEKFVDLFETEHTLKAADLVIADQKKILALAGVVGGLDSWITESTKNILVEIANFDPVAVRKTWTRLGLRTDAELRFEKNINPRYTLFCLILFLDELKYYQKDLGDFTIGWLSYYINPKLDAWSEKRIQVDIDTMEQFIFGQNVKGFDKKIEQIFIGLWFTGKFNSQHLTLNTPLWRSPDDLNIPEDIYEEVARIYGYDQIENLPLLHTAEYVPYTDVVATQRKLEDLLVRNFWCNQVETYPRISEKALQEFGKNIKNFYSLQNPINHETPYMRDDMINELLAHTAKNSKFIDSFKIFDIGKIRTKEWTSKWNKNDRFASSFVDEDMQLGVMLYEKNIGQRDNDPLLQAKNIISRIAKELEFGPVTLETSKLAQFHPKKQAYIKIWAANIGFVGSLHPVILQNNKIAETSGVTYLSLNVSTLLETRKETHEQIPAYETLQDHIVRRDLCFVIDAQKEFGPVLDAIQALPEIQALEVFDVYQGTNLPQGKKSVAFKIKITSGETMTTEQINEIMNKAIKAWEKAEWTLRA